MKKVTLLLGGLTCLAISFSACQKNKDQSGVSNELEKIETMWDGISQKNERDFSMPKTETIASDELIRSIQLNIQKQFDDYLAAASEQPVTELLGNWVGVIKTTAGTGGCNGYDRLQIVMDCEDGNPRTAYISGQDNYRPDWVVDGNLNMRFCIVPGNDFHDFQGTPPTSNYYGVLRVTTQRLPDAFEVGRYFDNEDNNNANSASLTFGNIRTPDRNGQQFNVYNRTGDNENSIFSTLVEGNTKLSFHVFGSSNNGSQPYITSFPQLNGLAYGVFGQPMLSLQRSAIFVDDEDSRNATTWYTDDELYTPGSPGLDDPTNRAIFSKGIFESRFIMYAVPYAGGFLRPGGQDTEMHIARVK